MKSLSDADRRAGLRERKKAKTRAAIQQHALRLFRERGYENTTVNDIAEAAEVSQSTFFRYFPTKEEVVLYDALDVMLFESLRAQPSDLRPIPATRAALRAMLASSSPDVLAAEYERHKVIMASQDLTSRMLDVFARSIDGFAEVLAERAGLPEGDFGARVMAGAIIGAGIAAWFTAGTERTDTASFAALYDTALQQLDNGL